MSQTVSKVYSYLILLLNINFNGMLNFGYTHFISISQLSANKVECLIHSRYRNGRVVKIN